MPIEWAGLGPELLLRLDRGVAEPLRVQLERVLRDAIRSGRLAVGERLPSSRVLAAELGISRGLVLECYGQLQAEGFLIASSGSATRVAPNAVAVSELPLRAAPSPRLAVDFRPGVPDLTSFPRHDWAWALREACRKATPLRRMRRVYGARRDALVDQLAQRAPDVELHGLAAGFHAVAHLVGDADEQAIVERARERSIGLYGMSSYRPSGHPGPPRLVLGFGNLTDAAIMRGVSAISDLL